MEVIVMGRVCQHYSLGWLGLLELTLREYYDLLDQMKEDADERAERMAAI